jgi:hypothetical protein
MLLLFVEGMRGLIIGVRHILKRNTLRILGRFPWVSLLFFDEKLLVW